MKTKGALIWEFNQPWSIEEIEIGDPVKDEVKIQMEASGMCHSDHHLVTGDIPMAGFPVLGGHEGAGIVTSEKTGRVRTVSLSPDALDWVETWVHRHRLRWERRLDDVATLLDKESNA